MLRLLSSLSSSVLLLLLLLFFLFLFLGWLKACADLVATLVQLLAAIYGGSQPSVAPEQGVLFSLMTSVGAVHANGACTLTQICVCTQAHAH